MTADPTLESAYSRALTYAERLTEALEDLDDHGGLSAVRSTMRPSSAEKLSEALTLVRSLAGAQLDTLNRRQGSANRPGRRAAR
jgi:hypothetical protein